MSFHAAFRFYGSLNDFLPARKKAQWIQQDFPSSPSIKDAIEALGVPHVEVSKLIVNGSPVDFYYLLQAGDQIEVFPDEESFPDNFPKTFVLDVHLGKLARLLRMLGFDTAYQNNYHDKEIVEKAVSEKRIVLTRDVGLLKYKSIACGYWLRSQIPEEQLTEVIKRFALCGDIHPFSRCMDCNGNLRTIEKNEIIHQLPPLVKEYYREFYQCDHCKKIYWKGSHFDHMQQFIEKIKSVCDE